MTSEACTASRDGRRVIAFAGEGLVELGWHGSRIGADYGGDAANAATMCARLGARARLLGRVGADPFGARLLAFWRARGVDTSTVVVDDDAPTGLYVVEQEGRGESDRTFTYWRHGSAGSRWSMADLADAATLADLAAVVVTGITVSVSDTCAEATWTLVEHAHAHALPVISVLNYRPALAPDRRRLERLAGSADIVIASGEDLRQAFPGRGADEIVESMSATGTEVVVTHGADGASARWGGRAIWQQAPAVAVRDTVGAGDAFAGAYVWARLCRECGPGGALAWGVAASALSVRSDGCASSYPDAAATAAARQLLPAPQNITPLRVVER